MSNDLVYRLRKRAEIRRQISTRKSVQEGKPDRIADLLEEAADELEALRKAAEMALKALESWQKTCLDCGRASDELGRATAPIQALRQALAQPKWVGFTDVERNNLAMGVIAQVQTVGANMTGTTNAILFIEEKLKEKNT
jgi:hypothetical protein